MCKEKYIRHMCLFPLQKQWGQSLFEGNLAHRFQWMWNICLAISLR